jgi:hypothetical protein
MKVLFEGKEYDSEHGSFFDRGSADSFYCRAPNPHRGGVFGNSGPRLNASNQEDVDTYMAGYRYNDMFGEKKEYE